MISQLITTLQTFNSYKGTKYYWALKQVVARNEIIHRLRSPILKLLIIHTFTSGRQVYRPDVEKKTPVVYPPNRHGKKTNTGLQSTQQTWEQLTPVVNVDWFANVGECGPVGGRGPVSRR